MDLDSAVCTLNTLGAPMYIPSTEIQVLDLYTVGVEELEEFTISPFLEVPFMHGVTLNSLSGSIVRIWGVFDSGAMVNAMCSSVYSRVKH